MASPVAAPREIRSLGMWWLRRDLRTADNEALAGAAARADALLPVFCFDPRDVEPRRAPPEGLGVPKLGPHRCRFLLEGLMDLRRELQRLQAGPDSRGSRPPLATPPPPTPCVEALTQSGGEAAAVMTGLLSRPPAADGIDVAGAPGKGIAAVGAAAAAARVNGAAGAGTAAAAAAGGRIGSGAAHTGARTAAGRNREDNAANMAAGDGGGSVGSAGGDSGGLVVRFGRPEEVLPRLVAAVAAHNPQLRHVALHHHLDLLEESVALERRVQREIRDWAAQRGLSISVHTYWDRTLYHPDDLPYHLYDKALLSREGGGQKLRRGSAAAGRPGPPSSLPPNADPDRFRGIAAVMTEFRTATQSAAAVRPSLPAPAALPPLPAPFGSGGGSASAGNAAATAAVEAAAAATAAADIDGSGGLGEIPRTVGEVYDAAPGGRAALQRLEQLVGLDYSRLLPSVAAPGGGGAAGGVPETAGPTDPRTAFPFQAGAENALRRLRYYVWGHPDGPQRPPATTDPRVDSGCVAAEGPNQRQQLPPPSPQQQPCGAPAVLPPSLQYFTNTRAQAVGVDSSTKLSPYVALGCITPRRIHQEVERVRTAAAAAAAAAAARAGEAAAIAAAGGGDGERGGFDGSFGGVALPPAAECDWLAMHLCIRDYFIYTVLKEGQAVLDERGIVGRPVSWRHDRQAFERWARGATGLPFVDANLRELAATGWMSNRGRQNVASLVTKDLGLDWRWGAELFECLLLDCDVAVNFCNWNYFAGVGNDPRNRHFKTVTQGIQYDEDAVLAATWLPELACLPAALRHQPWALPADELGEQYGIVLGRDYPTPIVDPASHVGQLPPTEKGKRKAKAKGRT